MGTDALLCRKFAIIIAATLLASCTAKGISSPYNPLQIPGDLYVFNTSPSGGSIEIFAASAYGNVPPLATLAGSQTELTTPYYGTVDSNGNMYAPNTSAYSVTTYTANIAGNVAPATTIYGTRTGLGYPSGIAVDGTGRIYVANPQHLPQYTSITVYAPGANGNVAPVAKIKGSNTHLDFCYNVALDGSGYIYVTNNNGGSSGGWITVYKPGSNGNVSPVRTIQGSATGLDGPSGITLDGSGKLYVTNRYDNSITVFAAGANGNAAPVQTIMGTSTLLNTTNGIALDSSGDIYVVNESTPSITVYPPGSNGNVHPSRSITGTSTGLSGPFGIAIH